MYLYSLLFILQFYILLNRIRYGYMESIVKSNYELIEKSVVRYLEENPLTMEELMMKTS